MQSNIIHDVIRTANPFQMLLNIEKSVEQDLEWLMNMDWGQHAQFA